MAKKKKTAKKKVSKKKAVKKKTGKKVAKKKTEKRPSLMKFAEEQILKNNNITTAQLRELAKKKFGTSHKILDTADFSCVTCRSRRKLIVNGQVKKNAFDEVKGMRSNAKAKSTSKKKKVGKKSAKRKKTAKKKIAKKKKKK